MSKEKDGLKRFFVKITPDAHRELRVRAAMDDDSVEIVGGKLLMQAIEQTKADAKRDKPKR